MAGPLGFTSGEWRTILPLSFAASFENDDSALLSIAVPVLSAGASGIGASGIGRDGQESAP